VAQKLSLSGQDTSLQRELLQARKNIDTGTHCMGGTWGAVCVALADVASAEVNNTSEFGRKRDPVKAR
jgi:hypothetical protein